MCGRCPTEEWRCGSSLHQMLSVMEVRKLTPFFVPAAPFLSIPYVNAKVLRPFRGSACYFCDYRISLHVVTRVTGFIKRCIRTREGRPVSCPTPSGVIPVSQRSSSQDSGFSKMSLADIMTEKEGCTQKALTKDGAERRAMGKACYCNQAAFEADPKICDVVCPSGMPMASGCACKDPRQAGFFCEETVCRLGNGFYCGAYGGQKQYCDKNVNRPRINDIPICSCGVGGDLVSGNKCVCKQYYSGQFCENYWPPALPPRTTTTRTESKYG